MIKLKLNGTPVDNAENRAAAWVAAREIIRRESAPEGKWPGMRYVDRKEHAVFAVALTFVPSQGEVEAARLGRTWTYRLQRWFVSGSSVRSFLAALLSETPLVVEPARLRIAQQWQA
jgi:hypothetical protein